MASRSVGPTGDYATIRAALIASQDGDLIYIEAGTYDITVAGYNNSLAYQATPNCSTGFINGVTSLNYEGAGKTSTIITGNARLFGQNVDGKAPTIVDYVNLGFSYSGGSGYILSSNATPTIGIYNLSFTGSHTGNAGASGNYADVRNLTSFRFTDSDVSLTGQAGFNGAAGTGGSSFLMAQGSNITIIAGNFFDETGYRNALSIFDSTDVSVVFNTFSRSSNRNVRSGGEKFKDTSGSVSYNTFFDGSYLAVEKTASGGSKTLKVTVNTFAQFDPTKSPIPNPITGGGAVGIVLQGANASTAFTGVAANTFSYVAPFANTTASPIVINGALNANTNSYIDPITNLIKNFNAYHVGGTANDTLTGTTSPEYFIGGAGNDTIATAGGADYILFNTALNATTNVDTITGFNSNSRIILDRKIFTGIVAVYDPAVSPVGGVIGAVSNSLQVENNATGTASNLETRIIYNTSTGSLFFDPDGSALGGAAAVEFAKLYSSGTTPYGGSMVGYDGTNLLSVNIGII